MALKATELLKNITSGTKVIEVDDISDLSSALTADFAQKSDIKNGKLTIQKNGVEIATFSANQDGDVSANIIADAPVWGNITGDLTAQTDLNAALSLKANENDFSVLSSQVNPANQAVTLSSGYYNCYDIKLNDLDEVADQAKICLKDYSFSKGYAIKFSTPKNQEVRLTFYKDEGSGPVLIVGSINEKYVFPMNSSYVIEVKFENIGVRPDGWTGNRQKMTFRTIEWVEDV